MIKIFNTEFEISLRVIVILFNSNNDLSLDKIISTDILSTYGKKFQLLNNNLNGDTSYSFSQIAVRRELITNSIKYLVIKDLAKANCTTNGFTYNITDKGISVYNKMSTEYFNEYNECVKKILQIISNWSDDKLYKALD